MSTRAGGGRSARAAAARAATLAVFVLASLGAARADAQQMAQRRNDPVVAVLRGRLPRRPQEFPRPEHLAAFRLYWICDRLGRRVGNLVPWDPSTHPTFRVAGQAAASNATISLDRTTKALWHVRNEQSLLQGRLRRVKAVAGEYDWFNREGTAIAALVPVAGTGDFELRGGDEILTLFVERYKVPLTAPPTLRERRFHELHAEDGPPATPPSP